MKALAVRQPWASLIVSGAKNIENRSWPTNHRGPLAIYASMTFAVADMREVRAFCVTHSYAWPAAFPIGGIMGVVNLVGMIQGCGENFISPKPGELPSTFDIGWYRDGAVGWVLTNPRPCKFVRYTGRLQLFDVADYLIKFES